MAKAILSEPEHSRALAQDAMVLMVPGYLWNVLVMQAEAEKVPVGAVFSKALAEYIEKNGDKEVAEYLWSLTRR